MQQQQQHAQMSNGGPGGSGEVTCDVVSLLQAGNGAKPVMKKHYLQVTDPEARANALLPSTQMEYSFSIDILNIIVVLISIIIIIVLIIIILMSILILIVIVFVIILVLVLSISIVMRMLIVMMIT